MQRFNFGSIGSGEDTNKHWSAIGKVSGAKL